MTKYDGKQLLLDAPKKTEYIVLAAVIIDTAVIMAYNEKDAAEKYEPQDEFKDQDFAVWAMTRDDFTQMMAGDGHKDQIEEPGCSCSGCTIEQEQPRG